MQRFGGNPRKRSSKPHDGVGGGGGNGRAVALLAFERGARVVIADRDLESATRVTEEVRSIVGSGGRELYPRSISQFSRDSIRETIRQTVSTLRGAEDDS